MRGQAGARDCLPVGESIVNWRAQRGAQEFGFESNAQQPLRSWRPSIYFSFPFAASLFLPLLLPTKQPSSDQHSLGGNPCYCA